MFLNKNCLQSGDTMFKNYCKINIPFTLVICFEEVVGNQNCFHAIEFGLVRQRSNTILFPYVEKIEHSLVDCVLE